MLVLSRKKNEEIVIGPPDAKQQVVVTVVEIRGDKVRLGISADKEVPVHRREVYEAIHGSSTPGGKPLFKPLPDKKSAAPAAGDSVPSAKT